MCGSPTIAQNVYSLSTVQPYRRTITLNTLKAEWLLGKTILINISASIVSLHRILPLHAIFWIFPNHLYKPLPPSLHLRNSKFIKEILLIILHFLKPTRQLFCSALIDLLKETIIKLLNGVRCVLQNFFRISRVIPQLILFGETLYFYKAVMKKSSSSSLCFPINIRFE